MSSIQASNIYFDTALIFHLITYRAVTLTYVQDLLTLSLHTIQFALEVRDDGVFFCFYLLSLLSFPF